MSKRKIYTLLSLTIIALVLLAYSNIYDNSFHFDDFHTIRDNVYVRDISNTPLFFKEGSITFSSVPANQVYRPIVTTSIAIDYWLSSKFYNNGYDVHFYHYSMMLSFILLLILLFAFFYKIFQKVKQHEWNVYFAFFATAFFGLHVGNAETINYIISRSDLLSTLFVVVSFDIYLYFPKYRKYCFFLIPFLFGIFTKLTAAMFIPLLMVYYLLFEYFPLSSHEKKQQRKKLIINSLILIVLLLLSVIFIISKQSDSFVPSAFSRFSYLITMPFVLLHYFITFFIPYKLSADTDWTILDSIWNWQFFVGIIFILGMLFIVFKTYLNKKFAPINFGILWFFIALAPTSSFIPLAEVLNDHRMFYPFIGLMLSVVYILSIYIIDNEKKIISSKQIRIALFSACIFILGFHFFATRHRTEVWDNEKSLWHDVTIKSPKNGRGLMNYGLQLMSEGDYNGAMKYYNKALVFSPNYSYLYINIAICFNAMQNPIKAEENFKTAIKIANKDALTHYYYGDFLLKNNRINEAVIEFKTSLEINNQYIFSIYKLLQIYAQQKDWDKLNALIKFTKGFDKNDPTVDYYDQICNNKNSSLDIARTKSKENPSIDNLLNLSLEYYNYKKFDSCIIISKKIIEIDDKFAPAYNNICAANNSLQNWNEAIIAGEKALKINPDNILSKNNLKVSYTRKKLEENLIKFTNTDSLINLSLMFYKEQMFKECIKACEKILKKDPKNVIALNNICSTYNALEDFEKAVEFGEKAIAISPNYQLAKNNLAIAKQGLLNKNK